jgi:4-hydroxy-tetrahydrodipicolinate reductase
MGNKIQDLILHDHDYSETFVLAHAIAGPQDPRFSLMASERPEVLVDFSAPKSTLVVAKRAAELKIPMLVCTTGFNDSEYAKLCETLKRVPWIFAPNTSLGVYATRQAIRAALAPLPGDYSVEIVEAHHKNKKDAPSGTAKQLAATVRGVRPSVDVPIHSLRGGTEVGEHRVVILGPDERIEITHRASDRALFAHGALKLAKALVGLRARSKPYTIDEVFSA